MCGCASIAEQSKSSHSLQSFLPARVDSEEFTLAWRPWLATDLDLSSLITARPHPLSLTCSNANAFSLAILGDLHLPDNEEEMQIFQAAQVQLAEAMAASEGGAAAGRVVQLGDLGSYTAQPGSTACFRCEKTELRYNNMMREASSPSPPPLPLPFFSSHTHSPLDRRARKYLDSYGVPYALVLGGSLLLSALHSCYPLCCSSHWC